MLDAYIRPGVGSIVMCRSSGLFSRLIAFASRSEGEKKTWCTHVGVMVSGKSVIESTRRTVLTHIHTYPPSTEVVIVTPTFLTSSNCTAIIRQALKYKDRKYGWLKILAHGADRLLGNRYLVRRLCRLDNYPICSYLVGKVYWEAMGYTFDIPYMGAQPDDIADHCRANPDLWKVSWYNSSMAYRRYMNGKE